jgi:hypothetical protein
MGCVGHVAREGQTINAFNIPDGTDRMKTPRRKFENNIKIDLQVRNEVRDWIQLLQAAAQWRAL